MRKRLLLAVLPALAFFAPGAFAATPPAGTVAAGTPVTWTGGPFVTSSPGLTAECVDGSPSCDTYRLTVVASPGNYSLEVKVTPFFPTDDYDLFIYDANGVQVGSSTNAPGSIEKATLESPPAGTPASPR